ncbi:MAG: amino acid ABC transporter substrate-binding protein [OCS116 cluster bacterium]|uniref:Amino acid ABC transporter substrate-binding protein n=1 Tax=OCS116 cluster bacterium TaxID=2030921 RepID=A0A2A4Z2B6_9PROT|nr:amino acid ABC transporter substrate-binding protein [OCS116 cluster bacterium]
MKKLLPLAVGIAAIAATSGAYATTLEDVKSADVLKCGVSTGLAGFATPDDAGNWQGLDVDLCRAVAAAVLGDSEKVEFVPLSSKVRFEVLKSGEIDVLSRVTTWTLTRDVGLGLNFAGVNYYDGQGFMVSKELGVNSASELDGASVCIQTGTTTELNLSEYFRLNNMTYEPVPVETSAEGRSAYSAGRCDIYTTDASALAAQRSGLENPADHIILPEIISKEPLGPVVRHGDDQWFDIVKWTHNAMLNAEELGVTSANAMERSKDASNPAVQKLLGTADAGLGAQLGLSEDWAMNIITQVGNYSESFERNVGAETPLKLARGLNALWTNGGIQYAPPIK